MGVVRVRAVLALALAFASGCSPSTAPLGDLAGKVIGAAIDSAAKPYDRRADPDYRQHVAEKRWACHTAMSPTRLVVPDGDAHLRSDGAAVRFVRYADCKVQWLDGCITKKKADYGTRASPGGDARRAGTFDVADEIDLFERVPAFSSMFGGRMAKVTLMRVELRTMTVRESSATFSREDLEDSAACGSATHWIASIEHGALRVNFDPSPYAGEHELEAQKVLGLGSYAACVREEEGACEAPVAVTIAPLRDLRQR